LQREREWGRVSMRCSEHRDEMSSEGRRWATPGHIVMSHTSLEHQGFLVLLCFLLFIKTSMWYLSASATLGYDLGRYFTARKVTRKNSHVTLHTWKIGLANARYLGVYYAASAGVHLYAACKFQQNLCCIWSHLDVLRTCVTWLCVLGWLISFLLNSFRLCAQSISCSLSLTLFPFASAFRPQMGIVGQGDCCTSL